MDIAVPPLLYPVIVNTKLCTGILTELRGTLVSFYLVSLTLKTSNVKLYSEIRVLSSSVWKESEEILELEKVRFFFQLFIKDESSQGL